MGEPFKKQHMDKITKLRLLCLKWVFLLEGYGNYDQYSHHAQESIERVLRLDNKHPDQWKDQECIDFMTQIIENGEQNCLYIPSEPNGKRINGHVPGSANVQG
jgi:electron transfer flavoprotein alpha subunit